MPKVRLATTNLHKTVWFRGGTGVGRRAVFRYPDAVEQEEPLAGATAEWIASEGIADDPAMAAAANLLTRKRMSPTRCRGWFSSNGGPLCRCLLTCGHRNTPRDPAKGSGDIVLVEKRVFFELCCECINRGFCLFG